MTEYKATFRGRAVRAIGVLYTITTTVVAEDEEAARLKLYEKWEHIQNLRLAPMARGGE